MPQLDIFTFYSQYFWFLAFFLLIYFRVVGFYLPEVSKILKLRSKIKFFDFLFIKNIDVEHLNLRIQEDLFLKESFSIATAQLTLFFDSSVSLKDTHFDYFKQNSLDKSNTLFLDSILHLYLGKYVSEQVMVNLN